MAIFFYFIHIEKIYTKYIFAKYVNIFSTKFFCAIFKNIFEYKYINVHFYKHLKIYLALHMFQFKNG